MAHGKQNSPTCLYPSRFRHEAIRSLTPPLHLRISARLGHCYLRCTVGSPQTSQRFRASRWRSRQHLCHTTKHELLVDRQARLRVTHIAQGARRVPASWQPAPHRTPACVPCPLYAAGEYSPGHPPTRERWRPQSFVCLQRISQKRTQCHIVWQQGGCADCQQP